jgi:UDP-N-acetylglucosamine acyltransferase
MPDISPYSTVEKGAKIAPNVRIGPFCYIGPSVKIASGCILDSNVILVGNTTLGENNHVYPMAVIGASADGEESKTRCVIGNANAIREHVTIYGGPPRKCTTIGQDNLVMIASQIGPGARIGDHGIFANCSHISASAVIQDYVRTSAFSFVNEGITVGAYTFVAGYVQIDRNAPPYAMLQGSPFRVRGVNSHNLKACGFGEADIRELKTVFRDLFNGEGNLNQEVLAQLRKDRKANPCVRTLIEFLDPSPHAGSSDVDEA